MKKMPCHHELSARGKTKGCAKGSGVKTAAPSTHIIHLNGTLVHFDAYNIEGNNYVKLRDIAHALDFNVSLIDNVIVINTNKRYVSD